MSDRIPIELWLDTECQHRFSPRVRARIVRLNPRGLAKGDAIRGYYAANHVGFMARFAGGCVGAREFIAAWGREAYRRLPRDAFWRVDGKRVHIRARWMTSGA